jgi:N-acetylmuramoyl-L-alanine amidase
MGTSITVKDGDTILSIAHEHQFVDWQYIWDHPRNAELRRLRPDPNILAPGDRLYIPDPRVGAAQCATTRQHVFRLKTLSAVVDLVLRNDYGYPFAEVPYELEVQGKKISGVTDANGRLCERVPPTAREGKLTVWLNPNDPESQLTWTLRIGHLNPITDAEGKATGDLTGVQARLNNLGFDAGPVTGQMNDQTRAAIQEFQEYIGHENPTGELDDETRNLLEFMHNAV